MLKIKNLTKYYGKIKGVKNLNLDIKKGEIFGFIGPNGAGKSTTIRCIMNLINKTEGEIYFNNKLLTKEDEQTKEDIGYLPSEIYLYDDLKVIDILNYSNSFYKKDCTKKMKELVEKLELDTSKKMEELSLGNLKKVGIVLALMHDPKLIILDEASSGLDPLMQEVFYEILKEEKEKGHTIFFSSHNLSEVKKICDRIGIIKNGELIKVESVKNLTKTNFVIVTIEADNISKLKKELDVKIIDENKKELKFLYKDDINDLIKLLQDIKIENLNIEEPSIEEMFMHFYK